LEKNRFEIITHQKSNIIELKPKLGRNDLCYCGSGKKYKNCCLKIDQDKEFTRGMLEIQEDVTDKYFTVKDYIQLSGYPVIKFDFFLIELLNIAASTLYKVSKINTSKSKEIMKILYNSSKAFYIGCIDCKYNCLKTPSKNISFKSLIDKGLELDSLPIKLQKQTCSNFFYIEFTNVFMLTFEEALCKELDEEATDEIVSILYWAIMDYISDNCIGNCNSKCLAEHNKNAYCKFCSFGSRKLPCPKDGEISYNTIKSREEDMEH
jgi:hypothetical protein